MRARRRLPRFAGVKLFAAPPLVRDDADGGTVSAAGAALLSRSSEDGGPAGQARVRSGSKRQALSSDRSLRTDGGADEDEIEEDNEAAGGCMPTEA